MYPFNYHRPKTLAQAKRTFAEAELPSLLAGGMTLLPTLKLRLAQASDLIDLAAIPELREVRIGERAIDIGATVCHADVASDGEIVAAIPALAALAGSIGDPQVRHRGTLGGSIANNDPAADYPAAVLALGASVRTDRREIAADDFFLDLFETALEPDEIVVSVSFPRPAAAAYAKFSNPASRYAVVGVFVARFAAGDVRVAVTGAGPCVYRAAHMEAALAAQFTPGALSGIEIVADGMNEDMHAAADYRAHLVGVMAKRAVAEAARG